MADFEYEIFCWFNLLLTKFITLCCIECTSPQANRLGGVMVLHTHLECDRSWVQTKDYEIGICCFSAEQAVLRSKSIGGVMVLHVRLECDRS